MADDDDPATPGWVVLAGIIVVIAVAVWVLGAITSVIGLLFKLVVSVALVALVVWFVVRALSRSHR